ncbi:MAG: glutathione S-transferase family protein [Betaproteobacteria bacterium]|nr:MAG: glutathione S-transferase family protein [Betaproteobacteria bacterium]
MDDSLVDPLRLVPYFSLIRFRVTAFNVPTEPETMIDLYAAGTSNGMRARIGLEECGLAYSFHPLDLSKGEQKSPSFIAMNPNGQIPVIVDSDGPGGKPVTVSQSVAVLLYCAEKSGKFLPKDPAARPAFWQALASAASDMSAMVTAIFTLSRTKEQHGPAIDVFKSMWKNYMKVWDDRLGKQRYAAGGEVTIADFALYGVVARVKAAQPALVEGFANVARWADAMAARPGVQRAMKF